VASKINLDSFIAGSPSPQCKLVPSLTDTSNNSTDLLGFIKLLPNKSHQLHVPELNKSIKLVKTHARHDADARSIMNLTTSKKTLAITYCFKPHCFKGLLSAAQDSPFSTICTLWVFPLWFHSSFE
jgi:hypothetical protein